MPELARAPAEAPDNWMSDCWVIPPQRFGRIHLHAASARGEHCRTAIVGMDACTGFRGADEIGKVAGDGLYLTLYRKGGLQLRTSRRQIDVTEGDIVAWSPQEPGDFACSAYVEGLTVAFPRGMVSRRLGSVDDIFGRKIDAADPRWTTLRDTLANIPGILRHAPPRTVEAMVESMLELSFHCMVAPDWGYRSAYSDRLFQRIDEYLDSQLGLEEITADAVAHEFGIGTRQLHRIFAERGMTLRRFMAEKRLRAVGDALGSRSFSGVSITELANRFGFFDAAHLSRSFKARYGMTPREYRQQQRAAN